MKSIWVKSMCKKGFWVKSLWVRSIGEHRDRWDAGFRSPLLRYIYIYYTIAFQFRSKSANFTLTLPAEAVPLVPIGGLKGPLVRFGQ